MDKTTLFNLDFYKIRKSISEFCCSQEGKEALLNIEPLADISKIDYEKSLSAEWSRYFNSQKGTALYSWLPIYPVLLEIKPEGAVISLEQAFYLRSFFDSAKKVRDAIKKFEVELGLKFLSELISYFPDLTQAEDEVFSVVAADGQLKELPSIKAIYNKIADLNSQIKLIFKKITSNTKYSDVLESELPVLRGDRQVLAVKSGKRSAIPGIVHAVSQSGFTIYIEPEEAVLCSNALIQANAELQQEIRKILFELTAKLRPYCNALHKALKIMQKLDCTAAAAAWGKINNCVFALNCEEEPLMILKGRHPLLKEKAVPIDLRFLEEKRILIITGPNAGGKTVTLKTIALFALLNQSGFPIPAEEGSRLPIFKNFFADIGDFQSLENALSTFSGHMKNIAFILNNADENSLVLLDEFGSGTEPQEGAAISMAVLDTLIEKKAFVLITTHHSIIKNYGYTQKECINASVEFSASTLAPSYKIIMGVPGESHAVDIAQKSGLSESVIKKANEYLSSGYTDISGLIKGLSEKHAELNHLMENMNEKEKFLNEKIHKIDLRELSVRQREYILKEQKQSEAENFLSESRKKLENLVRHLREGEITREKNLEVKYFISDLTEKIKNRESALLEEKNIIKNAELHIQDIPFEKNRKRNKKFKHIENFYGKESAIKIKPEPEKEFKEGDYVLDVNSRNSGKILTSAGKKKWNVLFGSIKIVMHEKDLLLTSNKEKQTPLYTIDLVKNNDGTIPSPAFELRLLGMNTKEALSSLERQLDLCTLNNFKQFSIIHGKGHGILQQMIQDYLSNCTAVAEFKFAPPEDGGTGKTYVKLF